MENNNLEQIIGEQHPISATEVMMYGIKKAAICTGRGVYYVLDRGINYPATAVLCYGERGNSKDAFEIFGKNGFDEKIIATVSTVGEMAIGTAGFCFSYWTDFTYGSVFFGYMAVEGIIRGLDAEKNRDNLKEKGLLGNLIVEGVLGLIRSIKRSLEYFNDVMERTRQEAIIEKYKLYPGSGGNN